MKNKSKSFSRMFERFATRVTKITGSSYAFLVAMAAILIWGISGPVFHFSDTWQLVINTGTTIITFLMVFVIQHSQNKDTIALQIKLNELIASHNKASNRLIGAEDLTGEELELLKKFYTHLSKAAKEDKDLFTTHSIEEAQQLHTAKRYKGPADAKAKN